MISFRQHLTALVQGTHRYSQVVHSACKAIRISCRFPGRIPFTLHRAHGKTHITGAGEESPPMGNPPRISPYRPFASLYCRPGMRAAPLKWSASPSGAFPAHHPAAGPTLSPGSGAYVRRTPLSTASPAIFPCWRPERAPMGQIRQGQKRAPAGSLRNSPGNCPAPCMGYYLYIASSRISPSGSSGSMGSPV